MVRITRRRWTRMGPCMWRRGDAPVAAWGVLRSGENSTLPGSRGRPVALQVWERQEVQCAEMLAHCTSQASMCIEHASSEHVNEVCGGCGRVRFSRSLCLQAVAYLCTDVYQRCHAMVTGSQALHALLMARGHSVWASFLTYLGQRSFGSSVSSVFLRRRVSVTLVGSLRHGALQGANLRAQARSGRVHAGHHGL